MGAGREPNHSSPWQTTAVTTYPQKQRCKTIMRGVCLAPALLAFLVHAKEEEDVKGRFLNPLNEDQAAAVTAGAVGLGLGVLGSIVVGKLVEDRANCGPLQHGAAGLLPGFLGALQDPRCRGARVQHSGATHATSQNYQSPQANYQVPATQFQYTPVEKFPASSQYQTPHSFAGPANQYQSPQIESQYQFTPEKQYPDLGPILNYNPDGQYPSTVPILSSQYQGPEQFQASPEYQQESSPYQGYSQNDGLIEKDSSGFKKPQQTTARPSAAQFGFGLPARPSGDLVAEDTHLPGGGFLTYSPSTGQLVHSSQTTHTNKISDTTSIDFFDLTPNPAIQPRTKAKTEILAEENDVVHFPGAHVRVPRQRTWPGQSEFQQTIAQKATVNKPIQEQREGRSQAGFIHTGFQQTAPHKATVDEPLQESRDGRSQSGFQQTGFQQTAPHKATVDEPLQESREGRSQSGFQQTAPHKATVDEPLQESREGRSQSGFQQTGFQQTVPHKATAVQQSGLPGIQGRSSSSPSRRSLDNRATSKELECAVNSESHAQCVGQEDGTPCVKKCKKPDCLSAVCCSGCCKRSNPSSDSQCGRKKIFEVEILDV